MSSARECGVEKRENRRIGQFLNKVERKKEKEKVWLDAFQLFLPVQSIFHGGTRAYMVPASIAQGDH